MKDFWRLISVIVSLAGFIIVAGALLLQQVPLLWAMIQAVLAFIAIWVIQSVLRALLGLTAGAETVIDDQNETN